MVLHLFKRLLGRVGKEPKTRSEIGQFGEKQTTKYLKEKKRYRLVCRNWKHRRDEIDLVVWDEKVLVFIEVRTRHADALVPGYDSITAHKKRVLRRVCMAYLDTLEKPPRHFRFDVVEVRFYSTQKFAVNHYKNVPLFSKHYRPRRLSADN